MVWRSTKILLTVLVRALSVTQDAAVSYSVTLIIFTEFREPT